jgi:hypothetical protein
LPVNDGGNARKEQSKMPHFKAVYIALNQTSWYSQGIGMEIENDTS